MTEQAIHLPFKFHIPLVGTGDVFSTWCSRTVPRAREFSSWDSPHTCRQCIDQYHRYMGKAFPPDREEEEQP